MSLDSVGRSGLIYAVGSILSSAISFLFIPLFMKHFSVAEYGAYSLIMLCGSMGGAVFYLGVTSALPRSYYDYETAEDRKRCFSTTLFMLFLGGLLQGVFGYIFCESLSERLFNTSAYADSLLLVFVASSFTFINFAFLTYLRLEHKASSFLFFSISTLISTVGLVYYFAIYENLKVYGALLGNFFAQLALFLAFIYKLGPTLITFRIIVREIPLQVRFGFFSVLSSLAAMSVLWVDQLFINEFLTLYDVGIYSLAVKLASVISVVLVAPFMQVFNPIMMEHRQSDDITAIFVKGVQYFFALGLLIICSAAFFFKEALYFIEDADKFELSLVYVPFLMFGILTYGLTNIVGAGFFYARKVEHLTYIYFLLAAFNVVANIFLIPAYGMEGAVASSIATYALCPLLVYQGAKRHFSFPLPVSNPLIMTLICALFVVIDFQFIQTQDLLIRIPLKLGATVLFGYLVLRYILEMPVKEAINSLLAVFRRKAS